MVSTSNDALPGDETDGEAVFGFAIRERGFIDFQYHK
jgi:hypothetical protein